ncbi:MAG TPA: hypothetical protein VD948_00600 [Rhodothermales bacterium]|nr:hypothetical protein [Rhodothermales bacterium]
MREPPSTIFHVRFEASATFDTDIGDPSPAATGNHVGQRDVSGTVARLLDVLDMGGLAALQRRAEDLPDRLDATAADMQALARRLGEQEESAGKGQ